MEPRWEHFPCRADQVGLRGLGNDPVEAFVQAALALTGVVAPPASVQPRESLELVCQGDDLEELLHEWLNALALEMETGERLFSRFEVSIEEDLRLTARVHGEPVDPRRHAPRAVVKAVADRGLRVDQESDGSWLAEGVVEV